jgi:superfamily II DNA or RNA helicase
MSYSGPGKGTRSHSGEAMKANRAAKLKQIDVFHWSTIRLWPHQRKAIGMISAYLASGARGGSALVRMPTGTGKTGVISVISRGFREYRNVLVVAPSIALKKQLIRDITKRFWRRLKVDPDFHGQEVFGFTPATAGQILESGKASEGVLVCTISTLQRLHADPSYQKYYDSLGRLIKLVIFDEGHREPAPTWAAAVRSLRRPTVLFTATPYRNDHKMFTIDPNFIFAYHHHSAVSDRFIRQVEFHENVFSEDTQTFVKRLLDFFNGPFRRLKPPEIRRPRVIIRCEKDSEITEIVSFLKRHKQSAIGVHERYPESEVEDEEAYFKSVPNPDDTPVTFWVHQNKLIEGIDDPRFCLLAIFGRFRNGRSLVQQVGRILRNPGRKKGRTAHVFGYKTHRHSAFWKGYLKYEQRFEEDPKRYQARQLFEEQLALQPAVEYFEDAYRERFSLESKPLHTEFWYRLSVNAYVASNDFKVSGLVEAVGEEWAMEDLDIVRVENPGPRTCVLIYVGYRNSPILAQKSMLEFSLGYMLIHRVGSYLFFYDSHDNFPEYLEKHARRIPSHTLQRLFHGKRAALSHISLINTDLGRQSVRSRTLQSRSIADTAPSLSDHLHFCSRATGRSSDEMGALIRRYVGFRRARISDMLSGPVEFDSYVQWLENLAEELQAYYQAIDVFERFAADVKVPTDTAPSNILFDLTNGLDLFITNRTRKAIETEDLCMEVKFNGKSHHFSWHANGGDYDITIKFEPDKQRYYLGCSDLETAYVRRSGSEKGDNLLAFLNREQPFRIITGTNNIIYAHSHFYEARLRLTGKTRRNRLDLMQIFLPIQELEDIHTEKGPLKAKEDDPDSAGPAGWAKGSLFHFIDTLGKGTVIEQNLKPINLLVCDDRGRTEVADFIAADENAGRLVLMHAKAFKTPKPRSVSALAEVCSQAVKNLEVMSPYFEGEPPNLKFWEGNWSESRIGTVDDRIRKGPSSAKELWNRFRAITRNPGASKEVWIVLGSGFSKQWFEQERERDIAAPEVVQLFYQLQSTWAAVSGVGMRLRILCSP